MRSSFAVFLSGILLLVLSVALSASADQAAKGGMITPRTRSLKAKNGSKASKDSKASKAPKASKSCKDQNPCENGTCDVLDDGTFECDCSGTDYCGDLCQYLAFAIDSQDYCECNVCENDGTCVSDSSEFPNRPGVNDTECPALNEEGADVFYYCICPDGFTGKQCEIGPSPSRMLSKLYLDGNDRQLFSLVEGDDLQRHLREYDLSKDDTERLGLCNFPTSYFFCQYVTQKDCFDPLNQLSPDQVPPDEVCDFDGSIHSIIEQAEPWAVPYDDGVTLLASDPGIWTIENFVDEGEIEKFLKLVHKYGEDHEMFGPCNGYRSQALHPSDKAKVCFKITPEHVCPGPYPNPKCVLKTDPDDATFIQHLLDKISKVWPFSAGPSPQMKISLSKGDNPPVDFHANKESISFILYASDGGASTIFPNAGVSIEPKKGMAATWLNLYKDGRRNPKAEHGIQAHPIGAGERLVVQLDYNATPNELLFPSEDLVADKNKFSINEEREANRASARRKPTDISTQEDLNNLFDEKLLCGSNLEGTFHEKEEMLSVKECELLMDYVNAPLDPEEWRKQGNSHDNINISAQDLINLLGKAKVKELVEFLYEAAGERALVRNILIRRAINNSPADPYVEFHTDTDASYGKLSTMVVALNKDSDLYEGGDIYYVNKSGVVAGRRSQGKAFAHAPDVVHGNAPHSGTRVSLFINLDHEPAPGTKDLLDGTGLLEDEM